MNIFDTRTNRPVGHISGPYLSGGDTLDVKNGLLLTGSYRVEDCLEVWDMKKLQRVHNIKWDPDSVKNNFGFIMSCRLDESAQNILAVSSREDKMRIISIENNEILHEV